MIGHLLGAAGAVEAVATVMVMTPYLSLYIMVKTASLCALLVGKSSKKF